EKIISLCGMYRINCCIFICCRCKKRKFYSCPQFQMGIRGCKKCNLEINRKVCKSL
ncbi:MAG: hypothetical protein AVDCRST_MAG96-2313, partial [uncultured Segetibacter sp.]